jgi:hypothetical protein
MAIPPDAELEHHWHDGVEHESASAHESILDPAIAKSRFDRYRASIEQRCGVRPVSTDRFLPRQPQKIAP